MRKKVLLAALSALALAACVNDETIEMNPGNAVGFSQARRTAHGPP